MTEIEHIEGFVGATLVDARRLVIVEDGQCFCTGLELTFTTGMLLIRAVPEDDSLEISVPSGGEDGHPRLPDNVAREDTSHFAPHIGQPLVNVWACFPQANYCDALDFGFGDLCLPNVKILSLVSEIIELSVVP